LAQIHNKLNLCQIFLPNRKEEGKKIDKGRRTNPDRKEEGKERKGKGREGKGREGKESKAKQSKAKQSKAKQSKAKERKGRKKKEQNGQIHHLLNWLYPWRHCWSLC